ncbi:STAS domain-containing protein [Oculatella sp. LEGE 06141]|uniref:STAS domain-containing protein n=1 Tax=Oculatella sp. LEGE 06141 TaxID=1828648 RepID=UPI00187F369C|nr:STAS domain-containing protein [Oculatella sp. LEGE 06141]MBE9178207.1 STAS domain-containing protein [Oculatella sp. LEGE 06141]
MSTIRVFEPERILSSASASALMEWIDRNLYSGGSKLLLIDLQKVSFMDSNGLGALITAHNQVQQAGGKLGVCSLHGQAQMLFELANMEKFFAIYASRNEFEQAVLESSF